MRLQDYPRPPADTGWGFHDSAGTHARPDDAAAYARRLRHEYGITWFKVLADGQNKVDLARAFTAAGIECVVRLYAERPHPHHVVSSDDVRAYVQAGAHYFEWGNEPNLRCEWDEASWNEGAQVDKVCRQWLKNAEAIRQGGGIPLLPALSPGGDYPHRDWYRTMFEWLKLHNQLKTLEGAALAIHNRPLNHPLAYPPKSKRDESGCYFLDYEWIDDLVRSYLGQSLPLLATEAGYEPGWAQNPEYPPITPQLHADWNMEILRGFRQGRWRDSLFCQCMWIGEAFGHEPFSESAWFNNPSGGDLPAVAALRAEWQRLPFARYHNWHDAPLPLPEDETATDPATLAEKCRWWLEEEQRQREAGNEARANTIRLSLIKLLYRLEDSLKEG